MKNILSAFYKYTPQIVGILFLCTGILKAIYPGQSILALIAVGFAPGVAQVLIGSVTVSEIYLGTIMLMKSELSYAIGAATILLLGFSAFLFYLSTLAHPPSCGCLGLTSVFLSSKRGALLGLVRNCALIWLLRGAFDYYRKEAKQLACT